MKLKIKLASSKNDLENVLKIRKLVFIKEQQIPTSIEIDKNENKSFYILAYFESQPVGTARWRDSGEGIKLERFAVLKQFRKKGIGSALTDFIIDHVPKERKIYLNSQHSAIGFYKKLGFVAEGPTFKEADITHQKMIYYRKSYKKA